MPAVVDARCSMLFTVLTRKKKKDQEREKSDGRKFVSHRTCNDSEVR